MEKFRKKEIAIISRYFNSCYQKANKKCLPFVLAGIEDGAGQNIIIEKFKSNREHYNLSLSLNCDDHTFDEYYQLNIIIRFLLNYLQEDDPEIKKFILFFKNFLKLHETGNAENVNPNEVINTICEALFLLTREKSCLLIIENLQCGSRRFVDFCKEVADLFLEKKNSRKKTLGTLYAIGFYKIEEFISTNLKSLISYSHEYALSVRIKNFNVIDFFHNVSSYFDDLEDKILKIKLWNITKGNITIFSEVLTYLYRISNADIIIKKEIAKKHLPDSREEFYEKYLQKASTLEMKILENIAFLQDQTELDLITFIIPEESKQEVQIAVENLLVLKFISKAKKNNKFCYRIYSSSLKDYLLKSKNKAYKKEKYQHLLEKYDCYYQDNLSAQLVNLKNLADLAQDDSKRKLYLSLLLDILRKSTNSLKKIEVLNEIIILERDLIKKTNYTIDLIDSLAENKKYTEAFELSKKSLKLLPNTSGQAKLKHHLIAFKLYTDIKKLFDAELILNEIKKIPSENFTKEMKLDFLRSKVRFYIQMNNFELALKTNQEFGRNKDFQIEKELNEAEILISIGDIKKAAKVLQKIYPKLKKSNEQNNIARIVNETATLELFLHNFNKAKEFFKNALKIYQKSKKHIPMIGVFISLSQLKLHSGQRNAALSLLKKAYEISQVNNRFDMADDIFWKRAIIYLQEEDYSRAKYYCKIALANYRGKTNLIKKIKYSLTYLEILGRSNDELKTEFFTKVKELLQEVELNNLQVKIIHGLANYFLIEKDYDQALEYALEAEKKLLKTKFLGLRIENITLIYNIYKQKGNENRAEIYIKKALRMPKIFTNIFLNKIPEYQNYLKS